MFSSIHYTSLLGLKIGIRRIASVIKIHFHICLKNVDNIHVFLIGVSETWLLITDFVMLASTTVATSLLYIAEDTVVLMDVIPCPTFKFYHNWAETFVTALSKFPSKA